MASSSASDSPQRAGLVLAALILVAAVPAKTSFLQGDKWAYTAGIVAIGLGAALVFFLFPKQEEEEALLARYHSEDG